ncbi:MAG TPA: tRNA (adenosine(37)-N6)-dimethylallyltransferase MiaA, partial [Burkholderiales bacterium]
DPVTARRLDPNDSQRIQRAMEVFYLSGKPMSELMAGGRQADLPYRLIPVALIPGERGELHARIASRFEEMLELGLINEVRGLREDYVLKPDLPSMRCVGYRQVWQYLDGEFTLAGMREKAISATRQLAKRQLTWLRGMPEVKVFDCLDENLQEQVERHIEESLAA